MRSSAWLAPLTALSILTVHPVSVVAQHDRKTENPTPLEAGLERRLGIFRADCSLRWRSNPNDDQKLTSLPRRLRGRISLNRAVDASWIDQSSRSLFTYIFPSDSLQITTRLPERVIPVLLVGQEDIPEPDSLETSSVYSQTCVSLARIAARGDLNRIPPATIQLAASREDSVNGSVTLAQGRFNSPLRARLLDRGAYGLTSHLLLWDHYANHSDELLGPSKPPLRYVTSFTGVLYVENVSSSSTTGGSAKTAVKADWMLGSLQVDAELSAQRANSMRSRTFDTYFFTGSNRKAIVTWGTLPSPRVIRERLGNVEPTEFGEDPKVIRNVPVVVHRQVEGIPEQICAPGRWGLRTSDQRLRTGRVRFQDGTCVFSVEFTASADAQTYDLSYAFAENRPIGSDTLMVPFSLRLSATPHPILRPAPELLRSAPGQTDPITGRRWVQWSLPIEFLDAEAPVDFSISPGDALAELRCGNAVPDTLNATFVSADATKRTFLYNVIRPLRLGEEFTANASEYDVCNLRLIALVPIKNLSQSAERTLLIRDVILPRIRTAVITPASAEPSTDPKP